MCGPSCACGDKCKGTAAGCCPCICQGCDGTACKCDKGKCFCDKDCCSKKCSCNRKLAMTAQFCDSNVFFVSQLTVSVVHRVDVVIHVRELLLDVVPVSVKDVMGLLASVTKTSVSVTRIAVQQSHETHLCY